MKRSLSTFVLLLGAILVGCQGGPTTIGDVMMRDAKETETLGKNWNDGQKLVEKGEKLQEKSRKLALESDATRTEAAKLIARGNSLIAKSESLYQSTEASEPILR